MGNRLTDALREPKTPFQNVVRRLAEAAMSVTHHDAAADEPGYIHEVQAMEQKFTRILRGKLYAGRAALAQEGGGDGK